MIQFKRGKTAEWFNKADSMEPLASGQPGYDTARKKLKIGDGKSSWAELPYAGGLTLEEIIGPEEAAKERIKVLKALLGPLAALLSPEDMAAVITYGKESPTKETVGQLYLQQYDSQPEADYVISRGIDRGWSYKIWKSGDAECWITKSITTSLNTALTTSETVPTVFYNDTPMTTFEYPIVFDSTPVETTTIQSDTADGQGVWLATEARNSSTQSGRYRLAYPAPKSSDTYYISFCVKGTCKNSLKDFIK